MVATAPLDSPRTRPFWDGIADDELRLPRCQRCGALQWYPVPGTGHACGGEREWTSVEPAGTVFSFTTVRRPFLPGATNDDMPITTVLIEITDAPGVRLVGQLVDGAGAAIGRECGPASSTTAGARTCGSSPSRDRSEGMRREPMPMNQ